MPKRKSDIATAKTEAELAGEVEARLAALGFERSGSRKKFVWKKGFYWTIFASMSASGGVAHFEVWNHVPMPGMGSLLVFFMNRGKLDDILADIQMAAAGPSSVDGAAPAAVPAVHPAAPPGKTVAGFAKFWAIFWIVGNIAAVLAPMEYVGRGGAGRTAALVMLLSAIVAVGYFMLLYKNPIGLYVILATNLVGLYFSIVRPSSGSAIVSTGLVIGIVTFFVTKSQVPYPFVGRKKSAVASPGELS